MNAIPATLPAHIACLGRHRLILIDPWQDEGAAAAIDSTPFRAHGGFWRRKHREAGEVPLTTIDPGAHWTKSGFDTG